MGVTLGEKVVVDSLRLYDIEMSPKGYYGPDSKPMLRGSAKIPDVTSFPIETLVYAYPEDSIAYRIDWYTESKIDAAAIFDLLCSKYGDIAEQKDHEYSSEQIQEMIQSLKDRYTSNLISTRVSATQAYMNNSYRAPTHDFRSDTELLEQYAMWELEGGNEIQFIGMAGQYGVDVPRFIVRYTNHQVITDHSNKIQEEEVKREHSKESSRKSHLEHMRDKASSTDF